MRPFTAIAAAIFALIAILHAYRLISGLRVAIGGLIVGQEVSWIALAISAAMAVGLLKEARG